MLSVTKLRIPVVSGVSRCLGQVIGMGHQHAVDVQAEAELATQGEEEGLPSGEVRTLPLEGDQHMGLHGDGGVQGDGEGHLCHF